MLNCVVTRSRSLLHTQRFRTSLVRTMSSAVPRFWARHCDAHTKEPVSGEVVGELPPWLNGRLIRNGPGGKGFGESSFKHLFDGMAVLHMVNIDNGKASYTSRYLESDAFLKNHQANRLVISEFGTSAVPDPCMSVFGKFSAKFQPYFKQRVSDNCSVNVLQVKDELLAMTEMNTVRIVDPETLDTKEEKHRYSHHCAVQRATAHPHVDDGSMVYNLASSLRNGTLYYAIVSLPDGDIRRAKIEAEVPCRWKYNPSYLHSFGLTDNYFIISETPLCFNILKLMRPSFTGITAFKALEFYTNENTKFRVISRKTGKEVTTNYVAPDFFNFHYMNCFEASGCLILDVCAADDNLIGYLSMDNLQREEGDPNRTFTKIEPRRYVLPIDNLESHVIGEDLLKDVPEAKISRDGYSSTASAIKRSEDEVFVRGAVINADSTIELPRINYRFNKKPYTYAYCVRISDHNKMQMDFESLVKLNVQTGEEIIWHDEEFFASEPVFVEKPNPKGEDDGVVIAILIHKTNTRKLALVVLDAVSFTEKARVNFLAAGTVTPTFHGQFMRAMDKTHSL